MASNFASNNYIPCTDELYVTRRELNRMMGSNMLADYPWKQIRNYRDSKKVELSLRAISNSKFGLTESKAILKHYADFEEKLDSFSNLYSEVSSFGDEMRKSRRSIYFTLLKSASSLDKSDVDDLTIKAMLNGMYSQNEPKHYAVLGYRDMLEYIESNDAEFNEDFLALCLKKLNNQEELVTFYREVDSRSRYVTSSVQSVYDECPSDQIESSMENFYDFLSYGDCSTLTKAFIALYYIHYLKPFPNHNDLIALLSCKAILSSGLMGGSSALLPLENLLIQNDKLNDINRDIQMYNDLTYFLRYSMDASSPSIEGELDFLQKAKTRAYEEEKVAISPSEFSSKEEKTPIAPSYAEGTPAAEEEPKAQSEPSNLPKHVEAPLQKEPAPKAKTPKVHSDIPRINPEEIGHPSKAEFALRAPKSSLSDKEMKEAARYILETNPNIRKQQAYFYVAHCTLGSYYNIQDFKRSTRCAYETARTSMDNLAKEGFYEKKQLKNKFVYTPIRQGEKK